MQTNEKKRMYLKHVFSKFFCHKLTGTLTDNRKHKAHSYFQFVEIYIAKFSKPCHNNTLKFVCMQSSVLNVSGPSAFKVGWRQSSKQAEGNRTLTMVSIPGASVDAFGQTQDLPGKEGKVDCIKQAKGQNVV